MKYSENISPFIQISHWIHTKEFFDGGVDELSPPKYIHQIVAMKENDRSTLYVDYQDVRRFHHTMAEAIQEVRRGVID